MEDVEEKTIREMSDQEIRLYVAFALESIAHLRGGVGALTPEILLSLGSRLREMN